MPKTKWTLSDVERIQKRIAGEPELMAEVLSVKGMPLFGRSQYTFFIGIDCGVDTGLALYHRFNKNLLVCETLAIHVAMARVRDWRETIQVTGIEIFVRVEDARLRKWIPRQKNEKAEKGLREGAGSVKRDAKIWEDYLTDLGMKFEMVPPKDNATKMDEAVFRSMTGFKGRTSNHARDAAALVYGF